MAQPQRQFEELKEYWIKLAERGELALQTSGGDRFRLNRFVETLEEAMGTIAASVPTYLDLSVALQLHAQFRQLQATLAAARDQALDLTVSARLQPLQLVETGGRPKIEINEDFLRQAVNQHRLGPAAIASLLTEVSGYPCSAKSVRRSLLKFSIRLPHQPTTLRHYFSDNDLDTLIRSLRTEQERVGIRYIQGALRSLQIYPTRNAIRLSLNRVYPARHLLDQARASIRRRQVYKVAGPNSVWHMDGQHEIVNFGIVVHGIIDGFSRVVVGLQASSNNTAATVLELFLRSMKEYGTPSRVRGDRGGENQRVAQWMEEKRGVGRGSFLWGTSPHNTRIERLWPEVVRLVLEKWYRLFLDLQHDHGYDAHEVGHLWLGRFLYLAQINQDLELFRQQHNEHPVSTEGGKSPHTLYWMGMHTAGVRGLWNEGGDSVYPGEEEVGPEYATEGFLHDEEEEEYLREVRQHVIVDDRDCPFAGEGRSDDLVQAAVAELERRLAGVVVTDEIGRWYFGQQFMQEILSDLES